MIKQMSAGLALGALAFLPWAIPAAAGSMPGMSQLSGAVTASKASGLLSVYAFNTDKSVGYLVYVVNGQYRATNLFPGHYEVTVRGTVGQLNWSLPQQTVKVTVTAGQDATADFTVAAEKPAPTYVGGMTYADAKVESYDTIYPAGRGRDVAERICFGCHTVHLFPYNAERTYPTGRPIHDKDGWAITVDRMAAGVAFNTPGKASNFDGALLSPEDRAALIDYLAENFGAEAPLRAVQQENEPKLDEAILAKVQYVEYRFLNKPGEDDRFVHTMDFDGNGNVWIMDRGAASLVRVDPRTADVTDHKGHGGGEFLALDNDGTVWYGGLRHYDPKTDKHDEYKFEGGKTGRSIPVSTLLSDSKGDIWLSLLGAGAIAKYDRATDSVKWWDVPFLRSRPYGITLDHDDKVWFAEYHNSGIASFDPKTETFRHYPLTPQSPTNIRRVGVDSKNFLWASTWGSRAMQNAALYRLNPVTGETKEFKIRIANAMPYDAEVDSADNIWVATDNHILKFDARSQKMTTFPLPERTDVPKLAVTKDGAVWYGPRNAGQSGGYGGAAGVLYPDKDAIKDFGAYYAKDNARYRKARYRGPGTPVKGVVKLQPPAPQNPGAYAKALGLPAHDAPLPTVGSTRVIEGGAAHE